MTRLPAFSLALSLFSLALSTAALVLNLSMLGAGRAAASATARPSIGRVHDYKRPCPSNGIEYQVGGRTIACVIVDPRTGRIIDVQTRGTLVNSTDARAASPRESTDAKAQAWSPAVPAGSTWPWPHLPPSHAWARAQARHVCRELLHAEPGELYVEAMDNVFAPDDATSGRVECIRGNQRVAWVVVVKPKPPAHRTSIRPGATLPKTEE